MNHNYYVYIATNIAGTLYIGVTNNIERRMFEHKQKLIPGFTARYNIEKLIYCEQTSNINAAISREKQLKNWSRAKKLNLIKTLNPNWNDLSIQSPDPSTTLGMTVIYRQHNHCTCYPFIVQFLGN